jgi:Ca-activated chloride channel homolog
MRRDTKRAAVARLALVTGLLAAVTACSGGDDSGGDAGPGQLHRRRHGGEQREDHVAHRARGRVQREHRAAVDGECVFVRPARKASGAAADLIVAGWPDPEANGPPPVIWSPAASGWGGIVNERAGANVAPPGTPFMLTPLVIAMPSPMAEALGWPDTEIGFADIVALAEDPDAGWASFGHPEWGPFRLGKTNPNFSTSGLNVTIAQYYAATGKTSRTSRSRTSTGPTSVSSRVSVESCGRALRRHHDDVPQQLVRGRRPRHGADLRVGGRVEEKSIIDYNRATPTASSRPARSHASRGCRSWHLPRARAPSTPTTRSSSSTPTG